MTEEIVKLEPTVAQFSLVGKRVERVDALEKATGAARYTDDLHFPGMLFGKAVVSDLPHARLVQINTCRAQALPEVRAVLTARDIPGKNEVGVILEDQPLIASEKVRYRGDCLALVAAETPESAEEACNLVEVELSPLAGVFSPEEGLKEDAPHIHENGNLKVHLKLRKGDVEAGFGEADTVLEHTYRVKHQEHIYMETQGAIAVPEPDGKITIYGSLQCPYYVQKAVSRVLGIGFHQVCVVQTTVGGGFGGKEDFPSEICARAALLAWHCRRPVKMILQREDDLVITSKRHPMVMHYRMGATKDGKLVAAKITIFADCGAYATLSPVVLFRTNIHAAGAYEIPHVSVDTFGVYTNNPPTGAMRGFGQPQVAFACESMIDEMTNALGLDPLEFRVRNALKIGSLTATSQLLMESVGLLETIKAARETSGWDEKRRSYAASTGTKRRGIGAASIHYGVGLGSKGWYLDKGGAHVQVWQDGTVNVAVGGVDMGQGAFTIVAQIAAETLGFPLSAIRVLQTSTEFVPDSGPSVASRVTVSSGSAVLDACRKIRDAMLPLAAGLLGVPASEVTARDGLFSARGRHIDCRKVVEESFKKHVNLSAMGWYSASPLCWDEEISQGEAYYVYSFATHIAEVEVDIYTGEVRVIRITAAHDTGRTINPQCVEGQIEGGVLQGIGYALFENMRFAQGILQTQDLSTYTIPTAADTPEIKTLILEDPYSQGPYGAKGIGEPALIPTAPAVANAIFHAVGFRGRNLPILPEDIYAHALRRFSCRQRFGEVERNM